MISNIELKEKIHKDIQTRVISRLFLPFIHQQLTDDCFKL